MEEARSHMQALYANENKSLDTDMLAINGGAVKALGGGKIGGYLVVFSGPEDPDLQGDYFTKGTDFFIESGDQRPILYRHGVHPVIKSRNLGKAKLTIDDVGVFVEGELKLRDNYEKAIYALAERGKLGWSSGSMSHLVSKNPNGKSFEITSWALGEASLTPAPVEGRTSAFAVKDISIDADELDFDSVVKEVEQDQFDEQFSIDGIPAIKAFCEAVSPTSMQDGTARSKAAVDATKEFNTVGKLLGEGFHSYASRLVRRSENRFLKEKREIHPATVQQINQLLGEIGRIELAFSSVKEALQGLKNISEMTITEQKALDEKARIELWNFCRIIGKTPEELN
jgi:phage head maturation protease